MEKNMPYSREEAIPQAPPSYDNTQQIYPQVPQKIYIFMHCINKENSPFPFPAAQANILGGVPCMATCPSCGARRQTNVNFQPSTKTHLLALLICMIGGICCCCIPYCTDSCQSANHTCSGCGAYVGTYNN
ncbi:hypothetical protein KR054_007316 [Drosophila jambulina]|nr:hypothetical protein KR054_007316 [Drosophila jambulina]